MLWSAIGHQESIGEDLEQADNAQHHVEQDHRRQHGQRHGGNGPSRWRRRSQRVGVRATGECPAGRLGRSPWYYQCPIDSSAQKLASTTWGSTTTRTQGDLAWQGVCQAYVRVEDPEPEHRIRHRRHDCRRVEEGAKGELPTQRQVKHHGCTEGHHQRKRHAQKRVIRSVPERLPKPNPSCLAGRSCCAHPLRRAEQVIP